LSRNPCSTRLNGTYRLATERTTEADSGIG
jgi:hypothetical protein